MSPSTELASAPQGRLHPPPSRARNARSASSSCRCASCVDRREPRAGRVVVGAALDRERSLPDLRQHHFGAEDLVGAVEEVEPFERGGGDDDRVELGGLLEPGGDVAAQLGEREVGSPGRELRAPAHGTGADARARGQRVERRAHERVERVRALGHRRDHQAVGRCRRGQVLRRVHGDVGAPVDHRLLHFLHEHAGATHRVDGRVGARVTRRGDDDQLRVAAEERDDPLGLPAGERAPARRDAERGHQASGSASRSAKSSANASA